MLVQCFMANVFDIALYLLQSLKISSTRYGLRLLQRFHEIRATCQMKLRLLSYLQSSPVKAACLEAFSQAQRCLAEKLAESADALDSTARAD